MEFRHSVFGIHKFKVSRNRTRILQNCESSPLKQPDQRAYRDQSCTEQACWPANLIHRNTFSCSLFVLISSCFRRIERRLALVTSRANGTANIIHRVVYSVQLQIRLVTCCARQQKWTKWAESFSPFQPETLEHFSIRCLVILSLPLNPFKCFKCLKTNQLIN